MKLSVIIPVYNSAEWIDGCLESLAVQKFKDFEILTVDDHGADDSMEKVGVFADAHPEIKLRSLATPQNSGPGVARNVGIDAAEGEYVIFIDADDTVSQDMFNVMLGQAQKEDADVAYCQARQFFPDGGVKLLQNPPYRGKRHFLKHYVGGIWNGWLVKRSLLQRNGLRFPPYNASEDSAFAGAAILMADKVACVSRPLYNYMVHASSVSRRKDSSKAAHKRASFRWLIGFAKDKGVYRHNRCALLWLYLKKAILVPIREILSRQMI